MRPIGAFQIQHAIEAADVPSLKTQSPSTLRWRLRVEIKHTRRFETTFMLGTPFGLIDSRRYRRVLDLSLVGAYGQPPDRYGASLADFILELLELRELLELLCSVLIAFHKPFDVISQFTPDGSNRPTLAGFGFPPAVYPIGRLDADSEGLLLLSDEARWNARILDPVRGHEREYWVQVEGLPGAKELHRLATGVLIQGRRTLPCRVRRLDPAPSIWPRDPPVRYRKTVPDSWLSIVLKEGKNRQVRRMTAVVGYPTLRLIRVRIAGLILGDLNPGEWRTVEAAEERLILCR